MFQRDVRGCFPRWKWYNMKDYAERMEVYGVMGLLVREHIGGTKSGLLESAEVCNRKQRYLYIYTDNTVLML